MELIFLYLVIALFLSGNAALFHFIFSRLGDSRYYIDHSNMPTAFQFRSDKKGDAEVYCLALMSELIRINNDINPKQMDYVHKQHLAQLGDIKRQRLTSIFSSLLTRKHVDSNAICTALKKFKSYEERLQLVDFLMGLATIDNNYTNSENNWVLTHATTLGISQENYNKLYYKHIYPNFGNHNTQKTRKQRSQKQQSSSHTRPTSHPVQPSRWTYTTLGIEPSATDEEVRKAYRRLAMKYHPDRVANADPKTKEDAANRFRQLNHAYQQIRKARRMK